MAEVAAIASVIKGGAGIYQGINQRNAARSEGQALEDAAAVEAAGLKQRANEARAAGQAAARERQTATDRVIGRQTAVAAASGAGASSGTILDLIGETAARGEEQRLVEMGKGESRARGLEDKADLGRWQAGTKAKALKAKGDAALMGSIFEGVSTAGAGVYKYGEREGWFDGGPDSDDSDPRTGWRTRVYKAKR